jgi:hypothetical protein
MFCISEAKKATGRFCCAYNCTNEPINRKGGLCHKHYARKRREIDPVYSRYNQFKSNATRRNKSNSITLKQFRNFCNETGYIIDKGKRGQNATIDCIINKDGYHIDNIQLLTNKQNASKGNSDASDLPF